MSIGGTSPPDRNVIQGNTGDGVIVYGSQGTGNTIATNFILDNGGDGVLLLSANNHVGQASGLGPAGAGNVISGNQGNGVHILDPAAKGNTVANNEIGTQVGLAGLLVPILGTTARPNAEDGILIEDAPANVIGGQVADSGNVIAGNTGDGIVIENYVNGTIPSIVTPTPTSHGHHDRHRQHRPGKPDRLQQPQHPDRADPEPGRRVHRVVGEPGRRGHGRRPEYDRRQRPQRRDDLRHPARRRRQPDDGDPQRGAHPNIVEGNFIGTVSGSDDYGNKFDGVFLYGAGDNTVGGTTAAAGNVVANNGAGIVLEGSAATGNLVAANRVGTTADGSAPLGNATDGVEILNAPANLIGGTAAGAGNVIAGNGDGVHLSGSDTTGNILWGNLIGTNSSGSDLIGNAGDGVTIDGNASSNTIGGTIAGAANTIAFNGGSGIGISSGTGNSMLSNAIFSNAQLGIVLSGHGNDAQAAPALTASIPSVTTTLIQGSLASVPGTSFLIQFFSNATADPSGFGQGQTLIGSTVVDDRFERECDHQPDPVQCPRGRAGGLGHGHEPVHRRHLRVLERFAHLAGRRPVRLRGGLGRRVERLGHDLRDPHRQPRRDGLRRVCHRRGHGRAGRQLHGNAGDPGLLPQPERPDLHDPDRYEFAAIRRPDGRPDA